jgi:hypothetical protein
MITVATIETYADVGCSQRNTLQNTPHSPSNDAACAAILAGHSLMETVIFRVAVLTTLS